MFINKTMSGKNNICGTAVRDLRKERGLSQRELADGLQLIGLDLGKNAIQRIESGERFVTDIEIAALSEFFKISPSELIRGGNGRGL